MNPNKILLLIGLLFVQLTSILSAETIMPEEVTRISLSNTDTNRVVCSNGLMNDVFFSTDKISEVPLNGRFGHIKFPVLKRGEELSYVTKSSEFHFICDGLAYTIIAEPKAITSKVIYLGDSRIDTANTNLTLMGHMPLEEQGIYVTVKALTNELPDSFVVEPVSSLDIDWMSDVVDNTSIALVRQIRVEGLGIRLKEYVVKSSQSQYLDERLFIKPQLSRSISHITLDNQHVEPGQSARLFIVERAN